MAQQRMNPAIKKEWLKALRSGKFKQGRSKVFHKEPGKAGGYCCLGVLCKLAATMKGVPKEVKNGARQALINGNAFQPPEVTEWAGLPESNPWVTVKKRGTSRLSLSRLNDSGDVGPNEKEKPLTFKQIAAIIAREL